jgi:indole-3-glycerol phosphate synthase/phosphoribosylanthranilate isomerase
MDLDPVGQAEVYVSRGVRNISILTEQNYFGGSLRDLFEVKSAFPGVSVLRKDFLIDTGDVEVSFRAGADACLMIASLLSAGDLEEMYLLGTSLGMTPLVELHSAEDVGKAAVFRPGIVGINSRNLKNFGINQLQPLKIRALINWDCRIIYESGVKTPADIDFVRETGFDGVLVGEAAVRDEEFAGSLTEAFSKGAPDPAGFRSPGRFGFWRKLYSRYRENRPLVKICGITSTADLKEAMRLGADIAGFILADSPRRVDAAFIRSCAGADIIKVGVVVLKEDEPVPPGITALLEDGVLDALQFHGDEKPEEYLKYPGYKALRLRTEGDAVTAGRLPGPAVLVDAYSKEARGGTGKRIAPELVEKLPASMSLWLAGGITPDNVFEIITGFRPELIDISSGLEAAPGIKDHEKMHRLFREIERAQNE